MSVVIPSLRGAIAVPGWAKNDLWRRARAVPSLDLRFADNKSLTDAVTGASLVTFTRASSGTVTDSAGVIQTAATDVPRFDHNPTTGESLGLLVEEQRTNSVVNSNSMTAVVTGSPGTLPTGYSAQGNTGGWTREVIGSGSIGALNYVDIRFSGTPTGSQFSVIFQAQGVVAASNGQSWSASVYHQLVGGAISNIGCFAAANLWTSLNTFISSLSLTPNSFNPTSTLQRFTGSGTISAVGTAFINWGITFTNTPGSTYDFTIRFACPQLELGAFPTSYIPTTTAAATRSADVASITGTAFSGWYNSSASTIYSEAASSSGAAYTGNIYGFGTSFNDSITHYRQVDFQPVARVRTAGVDEYGAVGNGAIWTGTSPNKFALALATTSGRQASNGALTSGSDDSSIVFPTVSSVSIGSAFTSGYFNGHIRRLTFWGQRLPNNVLQQITQ